MCSHLETFSEARPPRACEHAKAEASPSPGNSQTGTALSSPAQWQPPPSARGATTDQPPTPAPRSLTKRGLEEAPAAPRRLGAGGRGLSGAALHRCRGEANCGNRGSANGASATPGAAKGRSRWRRGRGGKRDPRGKGTPGAKGPWGQRGP